MATMQGQTAGLVHKQQIQDHIHIKEQIVEPQSLMRIVTTMLI